MRYCNDNWTSGFLIYVIYVYILDSVFCLSGHVCSRQKAETYERTYDRAFICPERYTTACGQLDWRRCTKYRVNTCYTPTQKYAIRYSTVEECCPGWKDAGAGDCTIPVCIGGCENGGHCGVTSNGIPECICQTKYYGDRCQYGKHDIQRIVIYVVLFLVLFTGLAVVLYLHCRRTLQRSNVKELLHLKKMNSTECEQLLPETSSLETETLCVTDDKEVPSAPLKE